MEGTNKMGSVISKSKRNDICPMQLLYITSTGRPIECIIAASNNLPRTAALYSLSCKDEMQNLFILRASGKGTSGSDDHPKTQ